MGARPSEYGGTNVFFGASDQGWASDVDGRMVGCGNSNRNEKWESRAKYGGDWAGVGGSGGEVDMGKWSNCKNNTRPSYRLWDYRQDAVAHDIVSAQDRDDDDYRNWMPKGNATHNYTRARSKRDNHHANYFCTNPRKYQWSWDEEFGGDDSIFTYGLGNSQDWDDKSNNTDEIAITWGKIPTHDSIENVIEYVPQ